MKSGIYQIINIINNKSYIGSSKCIESRLKNHFNTLKNNKHINSKLQNAYNKYGHKNFIVKVLEYCDINILLQNEQKWIDNIVPEYNIGSVGGGDNLSNNPNKSKIIKKISQGLKTRYKNLSKSEKLRLSENQKLDKNGNWKGGVSKKRTKCLSKKCTALIAINNISGYCIRCINRSGINNSFYGRKHSRKTINILKNKRKGKLPTNSNKIEINNKIYNSQSEAARDLNISVGLITYRIKHKKYIQIPCETHLKYIGYPKDDINKKIKINNIIYESITKASEILKIPKSTISYRLKSGLYSYI